MPLSLPTEQERATVRIALEKVVEAILQHPEWKPPSPNPTLFFVWDFVKCSEYKLSEFDNIKAGRPVKYPVKFPGGPGKGDAAALKNFQDVCSRTMMLTIVVNDATNKTAMLTGNTGPPLDFGDKVKDAVKGLKTACPEEHVMAGMLH